MLLPYMLYAISSHPDFGPYVGDYTALLVFAMKNVLIFPIELFVIYGSCYARVDIFNGHTELIIKIAFLNVLLWANELE